MGQPATAVTSLTGTGTPKKGGKSLGSDLTITSPACRAAERASSSLRQITAFSLLFTESTRARQVSSTSSGLT